MRGVEAGRESALMIGRGCELSDGGRGGRWADDLRCFGDELNVRVHFSPIFSILKTEMTRTQYTYIANMVRH